MGKDKCVFVPRGESCGYRHYSLKKASEILDVDPLIVAGLIRRGRLKGYKSEGKSGRRLYFASEIAVLELREKMKEVM